MRMLMRLIGLAPVICLACGGPSGGRKTVGGKGGDAGGAFEPFEPPGGPSDPTGSGSDGDPAVAEDAWAPLPGTPGSDAWKPESDGVVGYNTDAYGPCGWGKVYGVVCNKTKQQYVNGADIRIVTTGCDGQPYTIAATSDADGYYILDPVPSGMHTVKVTAPLADGGTLAYEYPIVVADGQLTDVTAVGHKECFKAVGDCPAGTITGYVCAPNGTLAIGGATVYVETTDCKGKAVKIGALSDDAGNYTLSGVPAKGVTVFVEKGSFQTQYDVVVPPGGSVHAPDVVQDACFPDDDTKIAVVTGDWDAIEEILGQLGLAYELYDAVSNTQQATAFLTDLGKMSEYDIIFFDCGASHDLIVGASAGIANNLKSFVSAGGSVYASDWAWVYVEVPWPPSVTFVDEAGAAGLFGGGPKVGAAGQVQGTVKDPGLIGSLGKQSVSINYDLDAWVVVQSAPATTEVHIVGNVPGVGNGLPLMVSFEVGLGKVLYTTFHNEQQITNDMQKILEFLVFVL